MTAIRKHLAAPPSKEHMDAGIKFALDCMNRMPKSTPEEMEAHISGVLILFWGAMWGSFGTEHAEGFIEAQLNSMKAQQRTVFTPPKAH